MLKASPAPHDFDTRAAAYHFGPETGEVRYTLVAEIPLGRARLRGQGRHAQGALLGARGGARREGRGARALQPGLAGRGAREEPRRPEAAATPCSRAASPCRPGATRLELVVLDQVAQRASVRKSVLVVAARAPGLVLSSLAVVKRTEPVAEGALESRGPAAERLEPHRAVRGRAHLPAGRDRLAVPGGLPGRGRRGGRGEAEPDPRVLARRRRGGPLDRRAAGARRRRPHPLRGERPDAEPRAGPLRGGRDREPGRGGGPRAGLLHDRGPGRART